MKFKKIISIVLFSCLVINNATPVFASNFSDDGRYESFEGSNITINNILESDNIDVNIEGNTLVNYLDFNDIKKQGNAANITIDTNNKTLTMTNLTSWSKPYAYLTLAPNRTYTAIMEVDNKANVVGASYVRFTHDINLQDGTRLSVFNVGEKTVLYKKFTTQDTGLICLSFESGAMTGSLTYKNMMVLEGDWEDKILPKYFEGMKSVGELEGNKLEIKSQNKNLLFYPYYETTKEVNGITFTDNGDGSITINGTTEYPTINFYLREINNWSLPIGTYNFKLRGGNANIYMIIGSNTSSIGYVYGTKGTFVIKDKYKYNNGNVVIQIKADIGTTFENITVHPQITRISDGNEDINHKFNKIEIPLSEPLRGIPNGAKDRIINRNGQWVIERNCGEAILDGSENWFEEITNNNIKIFTEHTGLKNKHYHKKSSQTVLSDKFINNKLYLDM